MNNPTHNSKENLKLFLNDSFFIFNHLVLLANNQIQFKDFPQNIKSNDLFIEKYFSTISSTAEEYSSIPEHLLKNEFFIYSVINKNPDIYLLADKSIQTEDVFNKIKELHKDSYLKYAPEDKLADINFCKEALKMSYKNYKFLPQALKEQPNICFDIVKSFNDFNINGKIEFAKWLPKSLKSNKDFVKKLLFHSPSYILGLPKEHLADKEMVNIVLNQDTSLFKEIDISLKNDKEFVLNLLKNIEEVSTHRFRDISNFRNYVEDIINFLPLDYFTESFCTKYADKISNIYTKLPKEHRKDMNIIKATYSVKSFDPEMYKKSFLNKIPNEDLRDGLFKFIKSFPHKEQAHSNIVEFLNIFKLKFTLEKELISPTKNKVRNKI